MCSNRRLRLWSSGWLVWAWSLGSLGRKAPHWTLRARSSRPLCNSWSPSLIHVLRSRRRETSGSSTLKRGIYEASMVASWGGESRGTRVEEALCLGVQLYEGAARALESMLEGRVRCERGEGVWIEGGTRIEARSDTVKRPQDGREICNGKVLAKWKKNREVKVREVFKNKFTRVFRIVLGVRNGFSNPLDFHTVNLKFADPLDFRIVCELVLGVRNGI